MQPPESTAERACCVQTHIVLYELLGIGMLRPIRAELVPMRVRVNGVGVKFNGSLNLPSRVGEVREGRVPSDGKKMHYLLIILIRFACCLSMLRDVGLGVVPASQSGVLEAIVSWSQHEPT
jgi:hypothetical protein